MLVLMRGTAKGPLRAPEKWSICGRNEISVAEATRWRSGQDHLLRSGRRRECHRTRRSKMGVPAMRPPSIHVIRGIEAFTSPAMREKARD
jgi:hypothetical protein